MHPSIFSPQSPGQLVPIDSVNHAFVPGPLPPAIDLTPQLVGYLAEAANAVGLLAGTGRNLGNPMLLIAPYIRREAVLSSRIEGTVSTMADLYEDEAVGAARAPREDVREVRNYLTAHEYGLQRLSTLLLSLRLLREVHKRLMTGVRGERHHPGEFRSYQNWLTNDPRAPIEEATFVPPPPQEMRAALGELESFLHAEEMSPLIMAALAHYQFEAIHPFGDGNGRVGRLLISLFLHARGLLPQPLLYLSAYFERTRPEYYGRLLRVSTDGDWVGWLSYFLEGVRVQAHAAVKDAKRLLHLQANYHEQLSATKARPAARELVDHLFINPYVTARRARDMIKVSSPTARAAIKDLVDHGILRETSGRSWGQLFLADEILLATQGTTDTEPAEA